MKTRAPAWCDRVLMNEAAWKLVQVRVEVYDGDSLPCDIRLHFSKHQVPQSVTTRLDKTHAWVTIRYELSYFSAIQKLPSLYFQPVFLSFPLPSASNGVANPVNGETAGGGKLTVSFGVGYLCNSSYSQSV